MIFPRIMKLSSSMSMSKDKTRKYAMKIEHSFKDMYIHSKRSDVIPRLRSKIHLFHPLRIKNFSSNIPTVLFCIIFGQIIAQNENPNFRSRNNPSGCSLTRGLVFASHCLWLLYFFCCWFVPIGWGFIFLFLTLKVSYICVKINLTPKRPFFL